MARFSRHLQYSIALGLYGLTSCLLPQLPSLYWFWGAWAVYGGTSAFIDIAVNVWVLELFEMHNVNLHVQFIHLSFSFGKSRRLCCEFQFNLIKLGKLIFQQRTNIRTTHSTTVSGARLYFRHTGWSNHHCPKKSTDSHSLPGGRWLFYVCRFLHILVLFD